MNPAITAAIIAGVLELAKILRDIWTAHGRNRIAGRRAMRAEKRTERLLADRQKRAEAAVARFRERYQHRVGR